MPTPRGHLKTRRSISFYLQFPLCPSARSFSFRENAFNERALFINSSISLRHTSSERFIWFAHARREFLMPAPFLFPRRKRGRELRLRGVGPSYFRGGTFAQFGVEIRAATSIRVVVLR